MTYTEPKLCTYGYDLKEPWFVYFTVISDTGIKKYCQYRGEQKSSINRFKSKDERVKAGNMLKLYWKNKLKNGWTPFKEEKKDSIPDFKNMELNNALDFGLKNCDVAKKTRSSYRGTVKFFKEAAEDLLISKIAVADIEKTHIKLLLNKIKEKRNWSNKAYNKNLGYIQAIFSELEEWKIVKFNPAHRIKTLRTTESQKFKPYTKEEKKIIGEYLFLHHYRFYILFQLIYHTGIRPKEALSLKIKNVDMISRTITIEPEIETENSKTRSIRIVPINQFLFSFLKQLNIESCPQEYYLFGSPFEAGKGNKGSNKEGRGTMHPDYFKPSQVQIKRDTITKFWKKIVIDKLGINKFLYSAKHTGCDDKILAGISIDALKELFGHSSKMMTEKYASVVKQLRAEEIMEKSPEF